MLFYHRICPNGPLDSNDIVELTPPDSVGPRLMPTDPLPTMHTVLAAPAADIDRFDADLGTIEHDATADSVRRYLEEWYPTKAEFKQHVRANVGALRRSQRDELQASAPQTAQFTELQELLTAVGRRFDGWRFYRALGAEEQTRDVGVGMVVLRLDVDPRAAAVPSDVDDLDLPGSLRAACVRAVTAASPDRDGRGAIAVFFLWGGGLAGMPDPRDVVYSVSSIAIDDKIGEGHPSEVFKATINGAVVAAKRLKDWKRTAGGSLSNERDWLLSFEHHNVLPYFGSAVSPEGDLLFLLTEFMPRGRLSDACRDGPTSVTDVLRYGADIARCVSMHLRLDVVGPAAACYFFE